MKSRPEKPIEPARGKDPGPSHPHDDQTDASQQPKDLVDEAEMESFPASDPPALGRDPRANRPTRLNPKDE